ncbi:hypothetical protein COV19_04525 [Candidatus Woesearchaeota archaeon CG10_big_fil_rev_8_21_14_0_10_44_13]|nr:MAG: hypothetical protein COV19_04525 [Candidatus Woesearchaeota archaeon CG10_big_fil_rev_8_21_14_0_10_44_13]
MGLLKRFKAAPLPSSFFLTSILGLLITAFYWGKIGDDWAFTFIVVFGLMFIALMISMSKAPADSQIKLDEASKKKR